MAYEERNDQLDRGGNIDNPQRWYEDWDQPRTAILLAFCVPLPHQDPAVLH